MALCGSILLRDSLENPREGLAFLSSQTHFLELKKLFSVTTLVHFKRQVLLAFSETQKTF